MGPERVSQFYAVGVRVAAGDQSNNARQAYGFQRANSSTRRHLSTHGAWNMLYGKLLPLTNRLKRTH